MCVADPRHWLQTMSLLSAMHKKAQAKAKADFVSAPRTLHIGVFEKNETWGYGWDGQVQAEQKRILTEKAQSPVDDWTYFIAWVKEEYMWCHALPNDSPGYCLLRQFLDSDLYDRATVPGICTGVIFHRGNVKGPVITEAEALRISDRFVGKSTAEIEAEVTGRAARAAMAAADKAQCVTASTDVPVAQAQTPPRWEQAPAQGQRRAPVWPVPTAKAQETQDQGP